MSTKWQVFTGPITRLQSVASGRIRFQWRPRLSAPWTLIFISILLLPLRASDHSDAPQVGDRARQDANLTDLHAFVVGQNLVLALSMNPAIPPTAANYVFPTDVTFEINIDQDTPVNSEDPYAMGGTILEPDRIQEEITFRIRFEEDGRPHVQTLVHGPAGTPVALVDFFAGLRDDPFIRGPREGRNVASIVLEVPLAAVIAQQSTVLIWATSKVEEFAGPLQELVGRSLRSMMPENAVMNVMHPRHQFRKMGVPPDVMIFDTSLPAAYPNGRALGDDVVDLVADARVLANDSPFPSDNDVPFLPVFPYLAPPHPTP